MMTGTVSAWMVVASCTRIRSFDRLCLDQNARGSNMNLLYQDGANTTITVLRVPAGVSEYGWMLEKSHFVYM